MMSDLPHSNRPNGFSLRLQQVIDRQHKGVVAWVFESPVGWQVRSDVMWNFQHMSFPVLSYAQASHPQGAALFEFLPAEAFCWVEPNYGYYQQGQNTMGQIFMPPMSVTDTLTRWMIPKYRGNRQNIKIIGTRPVPDLAQQIGLNLGGMPTECAGVKMEYTENGRLIEEEFYGIKVSQNVPYHGPMGMMMQTNWGLARAFRFRAEKGHLDASRELFWKIASSAKANPLWEKLCQQIMQQLQVQFDQYIQAGYSQIQAAGQLSRSISANNDAMLSSFEQQRKAAWQSSHSSGSHSSNHSPNEAFSDYIRGVETYNDPYYGESQQDYNYKYHWTDSSGNYQHSNDVFFNPNGSSNQNWTLMEPKNK